MKRVFSTIMMVLMLAFSVTTAVPQMATTAQAATVKLNKEKATLYVGEKLQLKVTGTKKKATWSSSNKKVASVSSKGKVNAKKEGTATIKAKINTKIYKCEITVKKPIANDEWIRLNTGNMYQLVIHKGEGKIDNMYQLAIHKGEEEIDSSLATYSSSNEKVATVDEKGMVTAKGIGECTITATIDGATLEWYIKVTDWLSLDVSEVELKVGESQKVMITYAMPWQDSGFAIWFGTTDNVSYEWDENWTSEETGNWQHGVTVTGDALGEGGFMVQIYGKKPIYDENGEFVDWEYYICENIEIPVYVTE